MALEMWHCPSCGAPQAESARCWVCRRSSTTCSTCSHFRPALAGDLGYCGRDARRRPLTGLELRGCWEPKPDAPAVTVLSKVLDEAGEVRAARGPVPAYRPGVDIPLRDFVPVEALHEVQDTNAPAVESVTGSVPPTGTESPPAFVLEPDAPWAERTSLFGDPEG